MIKACGILVFFIFSQTSSLFCMARLLAEIENNQLPGLFLTNPDMSNPTVMEINIDSYPSEQDVLANFEQQLRNGKYLALLVASRQGNVEVMKRMMVDPLILRAQVYDTQGVTPFCCDVHGRTPLHNAILACIDDLGNALKSVRLLFDREDVLRSSCYSYRSGGSHTHCFLCHCSSCVISQDKKKKTPADLLLDHVNTSSSPSQNLRNCIGVLLQRIMKIYMRPHTTAALKEALFVEIQKILQSRFASQAVGYADPENFGCTSLHLGVEDETADNALLEALLVHAEAINRTNNMSNSPLALLVDRATRARHEQDTEAIIATNTGLKNSAISRIILFLHKGAHVASRMREEIQDNQAVSNEIKAHCSACKAFLE